MPVAVRVGRLEVAPDAGIEFAVEDELDRRWPTAWINSPNIRLWKAPALLLLERLVVAEALRIRIDRRLGSTSGRRTGPRRACPAQWSCHCARRCRCS
jgi:hypothetical protein